MLEYKKSFGFTIPVLFNIGKLLQPLTLLNFIFKSLRQNFRSPMLTLHQNSTSFLLANTENLKKMTGKEFFLEHQLSKPPYKAFEDRGMTSAAVGVLIFAPGVNYGGCKEVPRVAEK